MKYGAKEHWDDVWSRKKSDEVSWYQKEPRTSIELILSTNLGKDAQIIDVGGGDSTLVDKLLELGFSNITILDISAKALQRAKQRLGSKSETIQWIECDIREFDSDNTYDIWHDRALLHFLTSQEDISHYVGLVRKHVRNGGYVIVSSFSTNGPMMCSGLDTQQHSEESMKKLFAGGFEHIKSFEEEHLTPHGKGQIFTYGLFRKTA